MANGDAVGNVHFVDRVQAADGGTNYIFRGSNPLNSAFTFNYIGLMSAIKSAGEKAKVRVPLEYRICDINLLQLENTDEIPKVHAERDFFQNNPAKGSFKFWETNGTTICPFDRPFSDLNFRNFLASTLDQWMGDTLIARTQNLRDLLETSASPTVVYVHCAGGNDRTGEMMAAYYMRWMNMSWTNVNGINSICASGPFGCNNFRAALWYAIYLNLNYGHPTDYQLPFPCNDAGRKWVACGPSK